MIIALCVIAYILIGFCLMLIWAKIDRVVVYCAQDSWWLATGILFWPVLAFCLAVCGVFYPIKLLFLRITK